MKYVKSWEKIGTRVKCPKCGKLYDLETGDTRVVCDCGVQFLFEVRLNLTTNTIMWDK